MRAGAGSLMHLAIECGLTAEQTYQRAHEMGFDCSANPQMAQFVVDYIERRGKKSS